MRPARRGPARAKAVLLVRHDAGVYHEVSEVLLRQALALELHWAETAIEGLDYLRGRAAGGALPPAGPGIELLEYLAARGPGRPRPLAAVANDLLFSRTGVLVRDAGGAERAARAAKLGSRRLAVPWNHASPAPMRCSSYPRTRASRSSTSEREVRSPVRNSSSTTSVMPRKRKAVSSRVRSFGSGRILRSRDPLVWIALHPEVALSLEEVMAVGAEPVR